MARIKLTKTELKAQNDALKRFSRFLPMLQLKKQQLQAEIAGISAKEDAVARRESEKRAAMNAWAALFASGADGLSGVIRVNGVKTGSANVAGVTIPVYESLDVEKSEIDLFDTPAWFDDAAEAVESIAALRAERDTLRAQRELISQELAVTSQRVNLFEKVKIPECKENIRVIKIAIGDEQTAAVTRGKIAKSRTGAQEAEP